MPSTNDHPRPTRRARRLVAAAVVAAAFGAGACSKSDSPAIDTSGATTTTTAGTSSSAAADKVDIKDFSFNPGAVTVKAGSAVTWTNQGATDHTVTADDNSFDAGHIAPGKTFSHTFAAAGTFKFHCAIHSTMVGTVTVQ